MRNIIKSHDWCRLFPCLKLNAVLHINAIAVLQGLEVLSLMLQNNFIQLSSWNSISWNRRQVSKYSFPKVIVASLKLMKRSHFFHITNQFSIPSDPNSLFKVTFKVELKNQVFLRRKLPNAKKSFYKLFPTAHHSELCTNRFWQELLCKKHHNWCNFCAVPMMKWQFTLMKWVGV